MYLCRLFFKHPPHTPPQMRVSAFIWIRLHLKETDSLTTVPVTEDTFKRSEPFSCQEADVRGCGKGRIYVFLVFFTGTNGKTKEYKGALQTFTSLVSLWPRSLGSSLCSDQYLFYFSGVYNVISGEDLTRSLSFGNSAGET